MLCLLYSPALTAVCDHCKDYSLDYMDPPPSVRNIKEVSSIMGLGRSPGVGNGNPLQYSCLENDMVREVWQATVRRITQLYTTDDICAMTYMEIESKKSRYMY